MAAFTSKADGNWSSSGQTTWTQVGVPGDGDTVTLSHNVTVDVNTTIGASGATGTAAVTWSSSPAVGKTLTVADGKALTVRGDLVLNCAYYPGQTGAQPAKLKVGTGSTGGAKVVMDPPTGSQYKIDCTAERCLVELNGISGNLAEISTSARGGSNAYISIATGTNRDQGVIAASYGKFTNLGDSANIGVRTHADYPADVAVSITNCTFSGSNYSAWFGPNSSWDGNFTFQYNKLASSVGTTINGYTACAGFTFNNSRSSGTRLIDNCSFDAQVANGAYRQCKTTNCTFGGIMTFLSSTAWPDDTYFSNNLFYGDPGANQLVTLYGPAKDCYLYCPNSNNHFVAVDTTVTAGTAKGLIFEDGSNTGTGDCLNFTGTYSGTFAATNCIILPSTGETGATSGKLISNRQSASSTLAITVEHCTYAGKGGEGGLIQLDETASSYSGDIASCKANLVWAPASSSGNYIIRSTGAGTPAVDAVTASDYNAVSNPNSGTCYYNTSTSQASVWGYSGIKVSRNYQYHATSGIGQHDIDISASGPQFADASRNLATWGQATQGADGTAAGAYAALAANPALIAQAGTGLLAWVRAGFRPKNSSLYQASYSGDPSTADAAGNAWAGARPDIGAMAYSSAAPSSATGSITLAGMSVSGSAGMAITATGSIALNRVTVSAAGVYRASASGAVTLGSMTAVGTSSGASTGSGAITLSALGVSASPAFAAVAVGAIPLTAMSAAGVARLTAAASGNVTLAALTAAGSGSVVAPNNAVATGAITLSGLLPLGIGAFGTSAAGSITLRSMSAAGVAAAGGVITVIAVYPDPFAATSTSTLNPFAATSRPKGS